MTLDTRSTAEVVNTVLAKYQNDSSMLVGILQDIQAELNYLPREALEMIAEVLSIPLSRVYSVATFFKAFPLKPRGRHGIHVCMGTACHVRGAALLVNHLTHELGIEPGHGSVEVNGRIFGMKKYDALYLPIQSRCRVVPKEFFDLAECTAPASKDYGVQFVSFDDVLKNPKLVNRAGFEPYSRTIHTLIGEANTKAGRLLAGVTMSKEGNWTSWPPHDHSGATEEIYLYVDLPDPNFAIHLIYWDFQSYPEIVAMVRDGDAVAIKKGYHYNVAAPGTVTTFVWMMAAIREEEDRVFTQVTVQPEFDGRFKLF